MKNRRGEVDGFWLFMIGLFVILPTIKYLTGDQDKNDEKVSKIKVTDSRGGVLEIKGNSTVSPINTEVKIPIKKEVFIVKKISPDRGDPEMIVIKGKYAVTSFDQKGSWDIDMYNTNNILVDWIKVTVY
jgi:hypothetical protein